MMRLIIALSSVMLFTLKPAQARTVYFAANAVSNFTLEQIGSPEWSLKYSTWNGLSDLTFDIGYQYCTVFVFNPSANTSSVNVTVNMDSTVVRSNASTGFNFSAPDPYQSGGTNLSMDYIGYFTPGAYKGTTIGTAALTIIGNSTTLAPGEFMFYEKVIGANQWAVVTDPLTGEVTSYYFWPFNKSYYFCSGDITVSDSNPNQPGFVVASGSLEYILSSYQNAQVGYGGQNTTDINYLSAYLDLRSTATASAQVYADLDHDGFSPCGEIRISGQTGGSSGLAWGKSFCEGRAEARGEVRVRTNNSFGAAVGKNATSIGPVKIAKVPIVINGGSPF